MKMARIKQLLPGRKGMSATAKILIVTLPIAAFIAGKMFSDFWDGDSPT